MYREKDNKNLLHGIFIGAIIFIIPLIVYLKVVHLEGALLKYWNGSNISADFFSYYKMIWILIMVSILILITIFKLVKKDIEITKTKLYIPMGIYTLFVVLSTIFSQYKKVAFWGFVERYEGMMVIVAYMLLLFIVINCVKEEKQFKIIIGLLMVSAVIIGTIGIFQYLGYDLLQTSFGKKLMLPSKYESMANDIKFQFGKNVIYSTLYHYNYVGSYMAMLFPLTLSLTLLSKKKSSRIVFALVSLLMFANWIASQSRAGIIGGTLSMIFLAIILRKKILRRWKWVVSLMIIGILILLGFNITSNGNLVNRLGSLIKDISSSITTEKKNTLQDVFIDEEGLKIIYTNETLNIGLSENGLEFKDTEGNKIKPLVSKNGNVSLQDNLYKDYMIKLKTVYTSNSEAYEMEVKKENSDLKFLLLKDGIKFINNRGEAVDLRHIEQWGFKGKETLGSARGYIWSRSIPLLKDTVFIGRGPDTFAIYFPQDDYIGKLKGYGTMNMLVDKAHDLYLQTALNTGVVSLIALLTLFTMYIISAMKLFYNNNFQDFYSSIGLALFLAVIGYLGAGLFNDSVVSVAPVFWVIFGMGISINIRMLKKERENI